MRRLALLLGAATALLQAPARRTRGLAPCNAVDGEQDGAAWAAALAAEFSAAPRDAADDLRAAAVVRDALETLKAPLERPWDDDVCVLVPSADTRDAFAGWFGLAELEAAADAGEVTEAGRGLLGAGGAWQMGRVGVRGEAVTFADLREVLDAANTCVLNSLDATCARVAALSLAAIDAFGLPVCTNAYATERTCLYDAAGATWLVRGDGSRRRRGRHVAGHRGRVAAPPRAPRGWS